MIKDLEKLVTDSDSVVFVNFHGLKVSEETMLRRELREKGVGYKISRKTLLARALKDKAKGELPELPGEVAIAFSKDQTASAREIFNFQKIHKSPLAILGGIFDGKFIDGKSMLEIAVIPSREVLYAQLANLLNSPIQRLAVVLGAIEKSKS